MNRVSDTAGFLRLMRDAILIALVAFTIGLVVNGRLLWKVFSGQPAVTARTPSVSGPEMLLPLPVELDEVRELLGGDTLLVDARSAEAFFEGHLPGARSLPRGQAGEQLPDFRHQVPLDRPLIVYCSGYGCPDSFVLAEQLLAAGYKDVRVFEGGLPEWTDAGLPVEKGKP